MSKVLINKNFGFLIRENFPLDCNDKVINSINNIHESIRNDTYEKSLGELRIIAEFVIKEFFRKNLSGFETQGMGLFDLTKELKNNFGIQLPLEIYEALNIVRKWGNSNIHNLNEEKSLSKVIISLKAIREIIWSLFGTEEKIEIFDEKFYYNQVKNQVPKEINIIEKKESFSYDSISNSEISINKEKLLNWVTLEGKIIMIPIYQRGYTWKTEQVEVLFNDIVNRYQDKTSHYFGIIAGKLVSNGTNLTKRINKVKIIDGQQRLTTSFLFICAVRDILSDKYNFDKKDSKLLSRIFKINSSEKIEDYFYNPGGSGDKNETFRGILKGQLHGIKQDNEFYENYSKFKELLNDDKWDKNTIHELLVTFLTKFELASISFDNDNISNKKEMEIFENLNSKGKELTLSELIKNFIFNLCSEELLEKSDDKEIPQKYNLYIFKELGNDNKNIEDFYKTLIHYNDGEEIKKNRQIHLHRLKETLKGLFKLKDAENIETLANYENLLIKIREYAYIYYEIMLKKSSDIIDWMGIKKILNICNDKKKKSLFIGLVYLIKEFLERNNQYDIDKKLSEATRKEIKKIIIILLKEIIKNSIITKQGDSSFKRNILESIHETRKFFLENSSLKIEELRSFFEKNILKKSKSIGELKISLLNNTKNTAAIQWLLVLTEWEMSDYINGGQEINYQAPSIEHIFPQDSELWEEELSKKEDFDSSKFNIDKLNYLNKIGNYFILNKPKNSSVGKKIFSDKKEKYRENTSPLYNNSNLGIDISKKEKWTFDDIDKRTNVLIDYICQNVFKDKEQ